MHAAPSIIVFTVLSGAGFGFLVFLGLSPQPPTGLAAFLAFLVAYALAVIGLLASLFHLGNPSRAWRAFSQWRSSWLSREGWASVAALTVMAVYGAGLVFFDRHIPVLGWIGAALSLCTIGATSMIYAQLATVPRWNSPLTPAYFLLAGLAAGALLAGEAVIAQAMILALGVLQILCWWHGDRRLRARGHSVETATGLGVLGRVRLFESPHTGSNFLLQEFVHQVGRRHRPKLRAITLALMCLLPLVLALAVPTQPVLLVAFLACLCGTFVSRWLFFAEAEHVVGLYYDSIAPRD